MFSIYLCSTYDLPDVIPGPGDASTNKINNVSLTWSLILIAEVNNKKRETYYQVTLSCMKERRHLRI